MSQALTSDRILDAAERLFAEHGITSVSLRRIISEAGVNIASVHYHFGSKEELIRAVIRRRIREINKQRLEGLETLRSSYNKRAIPIEEILRAFLSPALEVGNDGEGGGHEFFRCIARAHAESDPSVQEELFSELKEIVQIFLREIKHTLPAISDKERALRLGFIAGAMIQAVLLPTKEVFVKGFMGGELKPADVLDSLVKFCADGMNAKEETKS